MTITMARLPTLARMKPGTRRLTMAHAREFRILARDGLDRTSLIPSKFQLELRRPRRGLFVPTRIYFCHDFRHSVYEKGTR
jgi:hypothetical protein